MKRQNDESGSESTKRFREILAILNRHKIVKGLSPQKLRLILEDLGPTYIKLGQIMSMRADVIPVSYCTELAKLRTDVAPMNFDEVRSVIENSCGSSLDELFDSFNKDPLGSASIAQAHTAVLKDGSRVVVKVQRVGIYDIMARDISLLHKASGLFKLVGGSNGVIDFGMVLDELWNVTQEEMNFLIEAKNTEEFDELNRDVAFTACPRIYKSLTTSRVLVMEYIDGYAINDKQGLTDAGYDLSEIGAKLADNYMKQVIDDGFFHADPHPGNIRVREGRIVWIDLGMMGRISAKDQKLFGKAIIAVSKHDVGTIKDVILAMGTVRGKINHARFYTEIDDMLSKYGTMELGGINMAKAIEEVLSLAKENQIAMPAGLSLLARGVSIVESVVADLSAEINFIDITANRMMRNMLKDIDWKKEIFDNAGIAFESGRKSLELPSLAYDILKMSIKGQTKVSMELHRSDDFSKMANKLLDKLNICILIAALLIGSSLICTTNMQPRFFGIPAFGVLGYFGAVVLGIWLFIDSWKSK